MTKQMKFTSNQQKKHTICFFGIYNENYSRNRVLIKGFRENGWDVYQCRVDPREFRGIRKFFALTNEFRKLPDIDFDLVIAAYPGHTIIWLATLLFRERVIFDTFLSLYDSNVTDRKLYSKYSLRALRDWFYDWYSARISKANLLDTFSNINFYSQKFGIKKEKFIRVLVGTDTDIFKKKTSRNPDIFTVHFHGSFIPLQGIEWIVKAANLLKDENILFNLIGKGQTYDKIKDLAADLKVTNLKFIDPVPYDKLPSYIREAYICIGILGLSEKAMRAIPNKVFEYSAVGKPIITASSPAMREIFTEDRDVVFCAAGDEASLKDKILMLKRDSEMRENLSASSKDLAKKLFTPKKIVFDLIKELK